MALNKNIDLAVEKNFDALVKDLQSLIQIRSVWAEEEPGMPFGKGCADALGRALEICENLGFKTVNYDNYVGYAEIGEGEEMLGIVVHVDVVPEGNGWNEPPFAANIVDGIMWGRGTIDDKGPAVSCIYAVKAIYDAGLIPNKRIRFIFGADEETGWRDLEHYAEVGGEIPTYSIAPDANFPVIFAEKSMLGFDLVMDKKAAGIVSIEGGNAVNAVPDFCKAVVTDKNGNELTVEMEGVAAHASLPELGENAISKLMGELYKKHVAGEIECPIAVFYNDKIAMDYNGNNFGVNCEDESGNLSMNIGLAGIDGDNVVLGVDVRCPVTHDYDAIVENIKGQVEAYGIKLENYYATGPLYMEKDSELVKTLMSVYQEMTGDMSEPIAIGGATFARAVPNAVAFGALLPGRPLTEHQANEHIVLDDLMLITKIYAQAIAALVC
ncbi:MAG: M20 family metallopeptidase [Clostridiales bacterium]|nr:M20 family metallopeptidase [Clostridiales bacterium]